jgi:hypothetical protein
MGSELTREFGSSMMQGPLLLRLMSPCEGPDILSIFKEYSHLWWLHSGKFFYYYLNIKNHVHKTYFLDKRKYKYNWIFKIKLLNPFLFFYIKYINIYDFIFILSFLVREEEKRLNGFFFFFSCYLPLRFV